MALHNLRRFHTRGGLTPSRPIGSVLRTIGCTNAQRQTPFPRRAKLPRRSKDG